MQYQQLAYDILNHVQNKNHEQNKIKTFAQHSLVSTPHVHGTGNLGLRNRNP